MRVEPRLMPRAEKRVIEYFVSTQILQSILDLLHAAGKTERSELNAYACAYAVLDSCSEQFYGGVRKHFAHAQTVPLPYEASMCTTWYYIYKVQSIKIAKLTDETEKYIHPVQILPHVHQQTSDSRSFGSNIVMKKSEWH